MKFTPWVQAWQASRHETDRLFAQVKPQAMYERPIGARHRVAFYLGHLEAFDWNLLGQQHFALPRFAEAWDALFAFGIDPAEGQLPNDAASDWPPLPAIEAYAHQVRRALDAAVEQVSPRSAQQIQTFCDVMREHRSMHAETLQYMLHQLPLDALHTAPPPQADPDRGPVPHRSVSIPAGQATLGREAAAGGFGWDNEFGQEVCAVPAFAVDAYPVTHAQYQVFVEAGGYRDARFWRRQDWNWVQALPRQHPQGWRRRGARWYLRRLFDEAPLPAEAPVYVSFAEAYAYATFIGKRLPTEAQWHRAAYGTPAGDERPYPWGDAVPQPHHGNFGGQRWHACRVDAHPAGASALGVYDLMGNGWEWTRTPFAPLRGFAAFDFYPNYSAAFFDGNHFVLKGGSPATAVPLLRRSFRNWFQPHYPYIYATFRCVEE